MQSSAEKKILSKGPSLFDKKIEALSKIETSINIEKATKN